MRVGYARVSTDDQNIEMQMHALENAGCEKIFTDVGSARKSDRPGLSSLLSFVKKGDCIVVWHTSRLHRNNLNFELMLKFLRENGIFIYSTSQGLSTEPKEGKSPLEESLNIFMLKNQSCYDEHLAMLISVNTKLGLKVARLNGKTLGKPRKLSTEQEKELCMLYDAGIFKNRVLCDRYNISSTTLLKYVKEYRKCA